MQVSKVYVIKKTGPVENREPLQIYTKKGEKKAPHLLLLTIYSIILVKMHS